MYFGLTIEKLAVCGILLAMVIGPQRLPEFAIQLARVVRQVRGAAGVVRKRFGDELGMDDGDWQRLDPRSYDPKRIIRSALLDESRSSARASQVDTAANVPQASADEHSRAGAPSAAGTS